MIDSLLFNLEKAKATEILKRLSIIDNQTNLSNPSNTTSSINPIKEYCLLTLHRPSNVDNKESFTQIIRGLLEISAKIPVFFPVHPRTRKQIKAFGLESAFQFYPSPDLKTTDYYEDKGLKRKIHCFEPLGYLDFLNLMAHAKVVLTDSGGIQEETTVLNIPCITLRDTTERPITITEGTNVLVHNDTKKIVEEVSKILNGNLRKSSCPVIWDGHTAERIVKILAEKKSGVRGKE
jgi:UDP-N-acetylglucosamine 2-epimerase (non-hydrolysing)